MKVFNFSGDSFAVGQELEQCYHEWHSDLDSIKVNPYTLRRQMAIYKKHFPSLLDEIRGMAKAGGGSYEKLLYAILASSVDQLHHRAQPTKGCTIFGVKTANGLLVGRNYDWIPQARDAFHVYKMNIKGRYAYTAISDMNIYQRRHAGHKHWHFSAEDAINDQGLYIGLTFAHNPRYGYGLSSTHMIRLVAETCSTVEQAIRLFRKVPLMCAKNFFIADAQGNMVVIEHNSKTFKIVRPKDGILIKTNHYLSPDFAREDFALQNHPTHTTYLRYYETLREINKYLPDFGIENIHHILRRTPYVYANDPAQFVTVWSLAMNITAQHHRLIYDTTTGEKDLVLTKPADKNHDLTF
jgi:predicted choloylglycine hydrolase